MKSTTAITACILVFPLRCYTIKCFLTEWMSYLVWSDLVNTCKKGCTILDTRNTWKNWSALFVFIIAPESGHSLVFNPTVIRTGFGNLESEIRTDYQATKTSFLIDIRFYLQNILPSNTVAILISRIQRFSRFVFELLHPSSRQWQKLKKSKAWNLGLNSLKVLKDLKYSKSFKSISLFHVMKHNKKNDKV